jgi:hypothetical protein
LETDNRAEGYATFPARRRRPGTLWESIRKAAERRDEYELPAAPQSAFLISKDQQSQTCEFCSSCA